MARRLRQNPDEVKVYQAGRGQESIVRFLKETNPDALDKEAELLLERVIAEFGDVKHPQSPRTEGELAAGDLYQMRNLGIGKVAPEIEGKDHAGTPFTLQVIRLSFPVFERIFQLRFFR